MARFAVDTSCMVAAVCTWHQHHDRAADALNQRLEARHTLVVPAPALVETYAVLTRLPPPHRLAPSDAWPLIEASFSKQGKLIALDGAEYVAVLRRTYERGISGGRVYDAVIAQCAAKGRASQLLTFNDRDFSGIREPPLEVIVP